MIEKTEFQYELALIKRCLELPISKKIIDVVKNSRATAWIASGLSLCAAEYGRRMLQNIAGVPGTLFVPLDFVQANIINYLPILVTYRGRNLDIQSVAHKIVNDEKETVVLITGFKSTAVEYFLRSKGINVYTITLPTHSEEKRFVSILATLSLSSLGYRLAILTDEKSKHEQILPDEIKLIYKRAEEKSCNAVLEITRYPLWDKLKWIVLGGGSSIPAILGWQAALAEAGISSVAVGDLKDYTHGKYLSALRQKQTGFILLADDSNIQLVDIIRKRFRPIFPLVTIIVKETGVRASWEHLFILGMTVSGLSHSLGFNIRTPPKPKQVKSWTNWGKIKPYCYVKKH